MCQAIKARTVTSCSDCWILSWERHSTRNLPALNSTVSSCTGCSAGHTLFRNSQESNLKAEFAGYRVQVLHSTTHKPHTKPAATSKPAESVSLNKVQPAQPTICKWLQEGLPGMSEGRLCCGSFEPLAGSFVLLPVLLLTPPAAVARYLTA